MSQKFKVGDRVVFLGTHRQLFSTIIAFDYVNLEEYAEVEGDDGRQYWARIELLILRGVFDSPLYQALREY